jgi:pyoverdine/dityrosine biosynthesis protein Dit1
MFILRRITGDGNEVNICLNESYHLILQDNSEEFAKTLKVWDESSTEAKLYGFIVYNNGKDIEPLYKPSTYYIMCSDGKTFSNITFR